MSRGEYDAYYKKIDDDHRHNDMDRDRFFEGLVGFRSPAVEFLRVGDDPHRWATSNWWHNDKIPKYH